MKRLNRKQAPTHKWVEGQRYVHENDIFTVYTVKDFSRDTHAKLIELMGTYNAYSTGDVTLVTDSEGTQYFDLGRIHGRVIIGTRIAVYPDGRIGTINSSETLVEVK